MPLSREVVDALYRALLGRPADPTGIDYWSQFDSVEEVVAGFGQTEEFARRMNALSPAVGEDRASLPRMARLMLGGGLTSLRIAPHPTAAPWLQVLPWNALGPTGPHSCVQVLGPYAEQLSAQLLERRLVASTLEGLVVPGRQSGQDPDLLVLTEYEYLDALTWCAPEALTAVRSRVACPVHVPSGRESWAWEAAVRRARLVLHQAGFIEVIRLVQPRYSDAPEVIDVSHTTTDPDDFNLHIVSEPAPLRARLAWLVGNRVPTRSD
jgi:hypothetical protein